MSRIRAVLAVLAVSVLVPAGVALAATSKITGGTTTVTVSSSAANLLATNGITAKAIAPATQSGTTFTFPIKGGRLNTTTLHGYIVNGGGVSLSNGKKTVPVRRLTIVSAKSGVSIWAQVRGSSVTRCHGRRGHHRVCVTTTRWNVRRIATVTNVTHTSTSASGTVHITAVSAAIVNRLAGKTIVHAGDVLGTATVSPTFK